MAIYFHSEDIDFQLNNKNRISDWVTKAIQSEGCSLKTINFIFCSDAYLHNINVEYLNHDTLTDIITFPYSYEPVESDIFISIDRVKENAKDLSIPFERELHRVMIHGVLHLIGFDDKDKEAKELMTAKEDEYISLLEA